MKRFMPFACVLGLAALALLAAVRPSRADDRDLLREAVGNPYVFIVLDTSGSMHWSPKCPATVPDPAHPGQTIQVPANSADCAVLCPTGDCFVPLNGDDPKSKFYQAKQALYEVIQSIDGIQFGFGTYNQDTFYVRSKHWIYQAASNGPTITGYGAFPNAGDQEVFGYAWTCDEGSGNDEVACISTNPADLNDSWEVARLRRLPKAGVNFTTTVTVYVRQSGTTWRLRYIPQGVPTPGASLTVQIERARCLNSSCSSRDSVVTQNVVFNPVAEFLSWDNGAQKTNPELGYFGQTNSGDPNASNTCSGWDPTTDSNSDKYNGTYSIRWPTVTGDSRGTYFDTGDILPLDWLTDHKNDILKRLAPNTILSPTAQPNFGAATYFNDKPTGAETFLRLKNESVRPIVNTGSTPLGASVRNFRKWYSGCDTGTCAQSAGWKGVASAQDADWGCRRKYLLVLTDGDETCSGDPCAATAALKSNEGVLTYVVAFGVDNVSGNKLNCMASNGGTGQPIYPQNKDDLVQALTEIFGQIKEEASAFASAAVPSVQAEVADRIYLSSFTPLNGESVWDGHLDAFLKPLPLDAAGRPDRSIDCASLPESERSSCHLWDAGETLQDQAPDKVTIDAASTIDASVLKIGPALDERRVFYGKAAVGTDIPRTLRLFYPPTGNPATDPDWTDLFAGLGITSATPTADKTRAEDIMARTLVIKDSTIGSQPVSFVLGDVFHSDPVLIDRPNDFFAYAGNVHNENGCGYKCFADSQRYRRKMLVVGSNDGQLHFFDAGIWDPNPTNPKFTTGTGVELFSVIPRLILPGVRELAEKTRHVFGIDGTPRIDDVFIDPIHTGTPTTSDRKWRTVVIGGFREGGSPLGDARIADFTSGYYALDVTQPDKMTSGGVPQNQNTLPDCLSQTNQTVASCGVLPFPTLLWEFTDSTAGSRWDEDLNGFSDLGESWSVPTVGRVRVKNASNQIEDRFVAIFGGGMDAERKTNPKKGNWLYMVDVETGQPIYKRRLVGAVVGDPAAVDLDVDGYLDVLYIGTTSGFLYKVNISTPASLTTVTLPKTSAIPNLAANVTTTRVVDPDAATVSDSSWDPVPIFDTIGRPIYYAPVAFYVSSLNRFALAFGTGDREDLWGFDGQEGRFYLIIDDNYGPAQLSSGIVPLDENDFQRITPDGGLAAANADYVLNPNAGKQRGWYMQLSANERVITQAFGLAGVVIFSSYLPAIDLETNDQNQQVCARGGNSRIFVVYANNADPLMTIDSLKSRYRTVPEFVTNPYVEQGATKNPASTRPGEHHSEDLTAEQLEIMKTLKKFFPPCAKFGNYWISVSGIRSDTGYERYATIPIGICERNWKEQ